jgi:hypothetical protein
VLTYTYKDKFLRFSPTKVSKLNFVYHDLRLHAFTVLKLMNAQLK